MFARGAGAGVAVLLSLVPHLVRAEEDIRIPPPVSGRSAGGTTPLLPADLLARLGLLEARLENIRTYMGRSKSLPPLIRLEEAEPREVYAQAIIFHGRVQQLGFEQMRSAREELPRIDRPPGAADIMEVLNATLYRVLQLERHFGIQKPVIEEAQPSSTTPTEVFNVVLEAGQLAHELLDEKTTSSRVYSVILFGLQLARVLHAERAPRFLPEPAPFIPAKTPGDVYQVLLEAFEATRTLNEQLDHPGPKLVVREYQRDVVPDDVLELAGILLSQQVRLHLDLLGRFPDLPFVDFTRKLPSHSFQRASELKAILESLARAKLVKKRKR
ncbi:MAG: hypothetical protein AAFZ18_39600 [Myxococcota bacterium]